MDTLPQSPKRQAKHNVDAESSSTLYLSKIIFSLVHLIMSAFFVLSAYVNLNDPDPLLWISLYLVTAGISFVSFLNVAFKVRTLPAFLPSTLASLALFGIFVYARSISEKYSFHAVTLKGEVWEFFETEEGREVGGLAMVFFEMCIVQATLHSLTAQGGKLSSSSTVQFLGIMGLVAVVYALYAAFYLQPAMNARLQVEHCSGSL